MTTKPTQKDEGLLTLLSNILKKSEVTPENFELLMKSVDILSLQVLDMAKSIELLMSAIQSQNKAISDLYKVQEFLLTQLQIEPVQEQGLFPEIKKSKNEKPN